MLPKTRPVDGTKPWLYIYIVATRIHLGLCFGTAQRHLGSLCGFFWTRVSSFQGPWCMFQQFPTYVLFFPTCQVRVFGFYVSCLAPSSPPPPLLSSSPPQPRVSDGSVPRRTSAASSDRQCSPFDLNRESEDMQDTPAR